MPYKMEIEKIKLNENQDRRIKLTSDKKKEIRRLYHEVGGYSLNDLAKIYKVSKKTILITVNEKYRKKEIEMRKGNWKKYYDKKKHCESIQKTRKYKYELYLKGELKK